jgi:hypothetical protein
VHSDFRTHCIITLKVKILAKPSHITSKALFEKQQKIPTAYSSGGLRGVPTTEIPRNTRRKLDIVMVQYNVKLGFGVVEFKVFIIFFNCNWVDTPWQYYSTLLHIENGTNITIKRKSGKCGPCPVFASYTLVSALQVRKKHGKTSVRVVKKCCSCYVTSGKNPNTRGSQKIRFPILLPPNNLT